MKDSAISSFMSGIIAEDLASRLDSNSTEEAFICAMLHNLGRHLVIYYLPEEYEQIQKWMGRRDVDEATAARAVLGISYEELGSGVARA